MCQILIIFDLGIGSLINQLPTAISCCILSFQVVLLPKPVFLHFLYHHILIIPNVRLCAMEVRALYGRLSCGWLRVVYVWRPWLRWEVGGAG